MLYRLQRISVFLLAAAGLYAQASTAVSTVGVTYTSGMVGIAQGQVARVNVLNAVLLASTPASTPAACVASLKYYDANGALLKTATVSVAAGAAGHLDLFSDVDLALPVDQRKDIRATFSILPVPTPVASTTSPVAPVCNLIGNLEIFDEISGRTDVVIGGMHEVTSATTN